MLPNGKRTDPGLEAVPIGLGEWFGLPTKVDGYGSYQGAFIPSALIIRNAAEAGQVLLPLEAILREGGGFADTLRIGTDNGHKAFALPEALRDKITKGIQIDAMLRFIIDDYDGHVAQCLINAQLDGEQLKDLTLVSLDRGAAGSSLTYPEEPKNKAHAHRRHLIHHAVVDLDAGYSVPMPLAADAEMARVVNAFAALPLAQIKLDDAGRDPAKDAAYGEILERNIRILKEELLIGTDGEGTHSGPLPDRSSDSPDKNDRPATDEAPRVTAPGKSHVEQRSGSR